MRIDAAGTMTSPDQQQPNAGTSLSQDISNNQYQSQMAPPPGQIPLPQMGSSSSTPSTTPQPAPQPAPQQDQQQTTPAVQVPQLKGPTDVQPVDTSSVYSTVQNFLSSRDQTQKQQQADAAAAGSVDSGSAVGIDQYTGALQSTPSSNFYVPAAIGDVPKLMEAIGHFESGGNYSSVGPVTKNGDRALGKYQVMASNIPSWTKDAVGKSYTAQEFYSSPKLQDAVASYKMNLLAKQYGNVADVASVWFSGQPFSGNTRKDIIGTTVPKYVTNVLALYNKGSGSPADGGGGPGPASGPPQEGIGGRFPNLSGSNVPAPGNVTVPFGGQTNNEPFHKGIDIANVEGTPVKSPVAGVVTAAVSGKKQGDWGFGNSVLVKDAYGNSHRFSHLRDEWVKVGDKIKPGDGVGGMGNSGNSYSPSGGPGTHLDYRIQNAYGKYVNPASLNRTS